MPQLAIRNSPEEISASAIEEIRRLHGANIERARQAVGNGIRIGEILTQIKAVLRHGTWIDWVESNLPFGLRQAQKYISVYDRRDQIKNELSSHLTEPLLVADRNGTESNGQRLHESNFWTLNVKRGQSWLGCINHELKDHPIETWRKDQLISMAATVEPFAELYNKLKTLIG